MLAVSIDVPNRYKGMPKGLLGNFNSDLSDEFILPNGTSLGNQNLTESEIFYEFGQKCKK